MLFDAVTCWCWNSHTTCWGRKWNFLVSVWFWWNDKISVIAAKACISNLQLVNIHTGFICLISKESKIQFQSCNIKIIIQKQREICIAYWKWMYRKRSMYSKSLWTAAHQTKEQRGWRKIEKSWYSFMQDEWENCKVILLKSHPI